MRMSSLVAVTCPPESHMTAARAASVCGPAAAKHRQRAQGRFLRRDARVDFGGPIRRRLVAQHGIMLYVAYANEAERT
jgi:hypothetical protein